MCRLCLGTFLKAITVCVDGNSLTQGEDFREIFSRLDPSYGPEPDMISKFVRGIRNPINAFRKTVNCYTPDQYDELTFCMEHIANMFSVQREDLLVKAITKIIYNDDTIPESQIVDLVDGTLKKDLPGNYEGLSSFLTGVFLYTIKFTNNVGMTKYTNEIDKLFLADLIDEKTKTTDAITSELLSEDEILSIRKFLVDHESEKEMIPLCQIALMYDPSHNYHRSMYTKYNLLSRKIRKEILNQCDKTIFNEIDRLYWQEGLSLLVEDVRNYDLSSERYLYLIEQYFPRFRKYTDISIKEYETNCFKRLISPKIISSFPKAAYSDLDYYVRDYLELNKREKTQYPKPLDYLYVLFISDADEEDVVFWICRFIIDVCDNLGHRVLGKPVINDCYDDSAETIEDLSLSALFALHRHYMFHNNNSMGMEFSWSIED